MRAVAPPRAKNSDTSIHMPDFQRAIIYRIRVPGDDRVYIGSTCKTLAARMRGHKSGSNTCSSRVLVEQPGAIIELIEAYPCDNAAALHAREGLHQELAGALCVNAYRAGWAAALQAAREAKLAAKAAREAPLQAAREAKLAAREARVAVLRAARIAAQEARGAREAALHAARLAAHKAREAAAWAAWAARTGTDYGASNG